MVTPKFNYYVSCIMQLEGFLFLFLRINILKPLIALDVEDIICGNKQCTISQDQYSLLFYKNKCVHIYIINKPYRELYNYIY